MTRPFDLVCMGRAAVDLYGEQVGGRLEDMLSFTKYLGGSPANTAVGVARLGLRPAMLTRVGDEHNGRFVRQALAAEGVDVSQVRTDPKRLTALVFLGIQDKETFPLVFYRDNCADMAIDEADVDAAPIASATALLLSGTHLSQPQSDAACRRAAQRAKEAGTRVVLDIDYRPVLWGLTSPGMGEQRFVPSHQVSAHLQTLIPACDLVVGTEEEIHIAGGSSDTLAALQRLRELTRGTLVVKRGPMGCVVFDGPIPDRLDDGLRGPGFPVDVYNVLGAGDAFMAGFLRGWLKDEPLERCCAYANACGALVVSRHGCAPAMASWEELQHFLAVGSHTRRLREDLALEHLHRTTTRTRHWGELGILAFDHRVQFDELAERHGADAQRIEDFKRLVAEAARRVAQADAGPARGLEAGMILDSRFGSDILPTLTARGWWVARPVELPGSRPLRFEPELPLMQELRSWPGEHVVKCLVSYHPDDPQPLRAQQLLYLDELQCASVATFHEFLIEVIPPREQPADDSTLARALQQIYEAGIRPDWWKLPPAGSAEAWERIAEVVRSHDPHCRGVLLLGLEASEDELRNGFEAAAPHPVCRGFAVGRSIFAEAAAGWFAGRLSDAAAIDDIAQRYARLMRLWREARAGHTTSLA
ncbi:bifunctional 5-dehydro-2-deoxygluconokinase/5-dehydro-2-deoxyphosphogluconate aldolase [Variovorax saccharolyticus]|uniref:bifunctional 5-dehydro-2-deoxygluconokinase/5-dehydro-2- deoxyphosphogluconate aldolase n=1 Tax=Variovorax saccharolyticus TaxID=3053516 RepID=UPI0025756C8F|nr:5-dehydro-2-deoxygluconokinase [Variovorax sp. J31P216]MDM0023807.1 5-dehydro-2-deoxygluconokinase [Variovorax sp. J31P216]